MYEGIATTSSSDDELGRVKVECKNLWEKESTLLPVMNNIYISKGDRVVLFSPENLQQSLFVLGKFQSKSNQANDSIDSKKKGVLFQARVEGTFVMGTHDEKSINIETDKGLKINITSDSFTFEVPESYKLESKTKEEVMSDSNKCTANTQEFKASGGAFKIESNANQELFNILSELVNALMTTTPPTVMGSPSAQIFNGSILGALGKAKGAIDTFLK